MTKQNFWIQTFLSKPKLKVNLTKGGFNMKIASHTHPTHPNQRNLMSVIWGMSKKISRSNFAKLTVFGYFQFPDCIGCQTYSKIVQVDQNIAKTNTWTRNSFLFQVNNPPSMRGIIVKLILLILGGGVFFVSNLEDRPTQ